MNQFLIRGGTVIDPAQGIHDRCDIAIASGTIAAVAPDLPAEGKEVIDARGMFVVPGLIDLHCHVPGNVGENSLFPDEAGISSGVTTVCDAGSTGYRNFPDMLPLLAQACTRVFCFLHLAARGLVTKPEFAGPEDLKIDREAILAVIDAHRDIVKGIKLRAIGMVVQELGIEAVRVAKSVAIQARLPLMIHLGIEPKDTVDPVTARAFTREMLDLLDRGDILSHVFTWKAGAVFEPDGRPVPGLLEAVQRGVVLDVARARAHWSFDLVKRALDRGIVPMTLSTDLVRGSVNNVVFSLPATMSAFLAAGYTLEQLVEMTTINPARVLREEERTGTLKVGMPADTSILEICEGEHVFVDGTPNGTFKGKALLVPRMVFKSGAPLAVLPRFKDAA